MRKPSPTLLGGLIGAAYLAVTLCIAFAASGGDAKGFAVISQLLNLHVTYLLALLAEVLPLAVVGDRGFQFLLALTVNFILGGLMAKLVLRMKRRGTMRS